MFNESAHADLRAINALGMHRDLGGCDECRIPAESHAWADHVDATRPIELADYTGDGSDLTPEQFATWSRKY